MPEEKKIVKTPEFRASYPNVFKMRHNEMAKRDQFDIVMLFAPGADLSELKAALKAACVATWGDKIPEGLKTPFKSQDAKAAEGANGYQKGAMMMSPWTTQKPGVVGTDIDPLTGKLRRLDETEFSAGDYAVATVHAYTYGGPGTKMSPGVTFGLNNIQKTRDGEPLGNRTRPEDDFEPVGGDAGASGGDAPKDAGGLFD